MLPNIHALFIVALAILPIIVIGVSPGRPRRRLLKVVAPALGMGAIGMVLQSLLFVFGAPLAEWAVPMLGAFLAGLFVNSERAYAVLVGSLFLLAILLSLNSLLLRCNGFTSAAHTTAAMYQAMEEAKLRALRKGLADRFPPNKVLMQGPLRSVVPGIEGADWDRKTIQPVWHTWFSGLSEIASTPGEVWCPGGPLVTASDHLEWRAKGLDHD